MRFILIYLSFLTFLGCATLRIAKVPESQKDTQQPRVLKDLLGGDPEGLIIVEKVFPKETIQQIVSSPEVTEARLVKLVRPTALQLVPEHRLLDISPNGPYRALGFEIGDIIIGAHGYVIDYPIQFYRYVKSLPFFDTASFDIIRRGKPVRIVLKIVSS
ncbi:MAG: hypothetical protein N2654_06195 [Deltaproteobacteria bacterium]|nr:hypothetical protein [Deltaproteobacteria bacterium]